MTDPQTAALVRYRLEQAHIALDDARYLLEGSRSAQSVINRCYYAVFYAALALLQLRGLLPTKHAGVISLFDTEFVMKGIFPKELSKTIHRLFEQRQASDYRVTSTITPDKALEFLEHAATFVKEIGVYLDPMLGEVQQ